MLTMNSHGVEISIAGGVGEMVRDPNPIPSFFFSFSCTLYETTTGNKDYVQR